MTWQYPPTGETDNPDFAPEPFTESYQRSLFQGMTSQTNQTFELLRGKPNTLPEAVKRDATAVIDLEGDVLKRFEAIRDMSVTAMRIRCHGDYHLGQVLITGKDFVIIDFEGEPSRPLGVRRLKRSPLRDVAGMLRSFHYAAHAPLLGTVAGIRPEDFTSLEPWARLWHKWVGATFLESYLEHASKGQFLPQTHEELKTLLDIYLLEKVVYELACELNNRPNWLKVPFKGMLDLVESWNSLSGNR